MDENSGTMVHYSNDNNPDNYFNPIKLYELTIQLYEDTHFALHESQNNNNSFEFEITILNKKINI